MTVNVAAYFCGSGIEAQLSWGLCFRVSHELQLRCWPGLEAHLRLQWRRIHFQTHIVAVRIPLIVGCWSDAALSSLPREPLYKPARDRIR